MKTKKTLLLLPLSAGVATAFTATTSTSAPPVPASTIHRHNNKKTPARRISASSVNEDAAMSAGAGDSNHDGHERTQHTYYFASKTTPGDSMDDNNDASSPIPQQEEQPVVVAMSQALPFLPVSDVLRDSTLAGNAGFDPLHLAQSKEQLLWFREAEVKHARLAMLAAAGWPVSEMLDRKLASVFGFEPLLDAHDRAPSLFDNLKGLERVSPTFWGALFGLTAVIELEYGLLWPKSDRERATYGSTDVDDYFPGKLDLDPLGFYPNTSKGQQRMQLAEIKHGRIAMVAVVVYMVLEYITKEGIVDEVQSFLPFFPIMPSAETLEELEVPLMVGRFGMV